jgi:NADPH2:quinone reductase
MRAASYTSQGAARDVLRVGELEAPVPGPGEVRVGVHASGVNPVDVKRRLGGRGGMTSDLVIPHFDGAGVIDDVGPGVDGARVGERVWLYDAQWQSDFGTAAEFVTVPDRCAVRLPAAATFVEGACLGVPALTAHRCVFRDGSVDGKTVLVTGGAGAVANYAIQFASLSGARVISTASSDEKAAVASSAGAELVIDYRREDVATRILEDTGDGVDRIVEVEFGGNLEAALGAAKPGAVISTYASETEPRPAIPFYAMMYRSLSVHFELVFMMPESAKTRAASDISRWLDEGCLTHRVAATYPLADIAAAHEAVEAGGSGKVIVELEGDREP